MERRRVREALRDTMQCAFAAHIAGAVQQARAIEAVVDQRRKGDKHDGRQHEQSPQPA